MTRDERHPTSEYHGRLCQLIDLSGDDSLPGCYPPSSVNASVDRRRLNSNDTPLGWLPAGPTR